MHLLRVAGISTNGASAGAQTKLCEKNWSRAYCVPFTVISEWASRISVKRLLCIYTIWPLGDL